MTDDVLPTSPNKPPATSAQSDRSGGITLANPDQRPQKVIVRKTGPIGSLLRPVGLAAGLLLAGYGLMSLGTTYYRSYQRHLDHTKAVHADKSVMDVFVGSAIPQGSVKLKVRDRDGRLRYVIAGKQEADKFVTETLAMLDEERGKVKRAASDDIDRIFAYAFADREQALNTYADWFFEWKRSYVILKESLTSAATRLVQAGEYESLSEAIERDVRDYFMRHYSEQVLKPEIRDERITTGLEASVRNSLESYRRVIANGDARMQLFLAKHTQYLEEIPASQQITNVKLDWDAQKWKSPTFLTEDKAFEGIAGVGRAAAGGTIGALVLGPVMNRAMARSFSGLSRRFVTSMGSRIAYAGRGAAVGTAVEPVGGQVVGALVGVLIGAAADYFINKADEKFNRDKFIAANNEALEATITAWRGKLKDNVAQAIDRWFDDAQASVVLAREEEEGVG